MQFCGLCSSWNNAKSQRRPLTYWPLPPSGNVQYITVNHQSILYVKFWTRIFIPVAPQAAQLSQFASLHDDDDAVPMHRCWWHRLLPVIHLSLWSTWITSQASHMPLSFTSGLLISLPRQPDIKALVTLQLEAQSTAESIYFSSPVCTSVWFLVRPWLLCNGASDTSVETFVHYAACCITTVRHSTWNSSSAGVDRWERREAHSLKRLSVVVQHFPLEEHSNWSCGDPRKFWQSASTSFRAVNISINVK